MNQVEDINILNEFCIKFCKIIEKYTGYIIVSGFVAIASGRVRGTEDIDMIIEKINKEKFGKLHKELVKANFVCMQSDNTDEIYKYLNDNLNIRYTYKNKLIPQMEIKFVKDELDDYQIKTRIKIPLTGLDNVWFSSINMNIAFKEELLKSEKDLEDAEHLRIVFEDQVDEKEINEIKGKIKKFRL